MKDNGVRGYDYNDVDEPWWSRVEDASDMESSVEPACCIPFLVISIAQESQNAS